MPSTLITGTNRGLGLEFTRQYLADGWQVYAACRHPHSASELRRLAGASDDKLQILALDVTDPVSFQAAAESSTGKPLTFSSTMLASADLEARPSGYRLRGVGEGARCQPHGSPARY
jgi:NAD(P)-dependent dehydrogenase (short-subunit alcohol dehydrogenase family)